MGKKKTQRTITKIQKNHCWYTCSSAQDTCIAAAAWCQVGKSWPNDLSQRLVLLAQIMPTTHQNIFATGIHPFVIFICFIHYKHESDRIRMESDSDSTFYHILTRIWIGFGCCRIRCKTDVSNLDTDSDIYLIWNIVIFVWFIHYKHISKVSLSHYTIRIKVCNRCS